MHRGKGKGKRKGKGKGKGVHGVPARGCFAGLRVLLVPSAGLSSRRRQLFAGKIAENGVSPRARGLWA